MDTVVATDESLKQIPNLGIPQLIYRLESKLSEDKTSNVDELRNSIMKYIADDNMALFYQSVCSRLGWTIDDDLLQKMKEENEKNFKSIETKHKDAVENAGDMEVLDCMFEKARLCAQIGDTEAAYVAYDAIIKKDKMSTGKKIDAGMEKSRVALFKMDTKVLKDTILETKKLVDAGGDWDRRNRLKVYEALYLITCREIRKASELLLECIATFTCTEICSYQQFMFYTIVTSMISLSRTQMKSQLVKNAQVTATIRDMPVVKTLLFSLYDCEYQQFMQALLGIYPDIAHDRYLGPHVRYILREYRVLGYGQFLEAYKSVMLSSMATSFGLSIPLLDTELSKFIAAGRLNAKIDKVGDVIETSRPDKKNSQYQEVVKKGDALLNHIQKLARVIDV